MKIGFDAKRLFHNDTGLGNYSRTLIRNLVKYYPENEYHLFTPSIKEIEELTFFCDRSRFQIHTCSKGSKSLWRSLGIPKLLDKYQLDIYHGLSHELPLKRPKGETKYIVSFHDLIYEIYPKLFPLFDRKMYQMKYRKSAKLADHIVSISSSTSNDLHRLYGTDLGKTTRVFQSCHPDYLKDFEPKDHETDPPYFLYVGSLIPRKGLLEIAKAYSALDKGYRIPIKIVGAGEPYKKRVVSFLEEHKLEQHFEFQGKIQNHRLIQLYRNAKALLLPSVYEGFGIPVIEALSQATPCITSTVSSLPEAAGPGGILVDPKNIHDLVKAMMSVIDHPKESKTRGLLGQAYVRQNFNAKSTTEQLMAVYQKSLSL